MERFTEEKGLKGMDELFRKAALLAQNPGDFEDIPELSEDDKIVIRRETTRTPDVLLTCCYLFNWSLFQIAGVNLKTFI